MLQNVLTYPQTAVMTMPNILGGKPRPRFRALYPKLDLRLSENDLRLLTFVYQYRVLTTNQIYALLPEWSEHTLSKRLTELYHHGYLDRPSLQRYFQLTKKEDWNMIYAPTSKCLATITIDTKTDYTTKNARLSPGFLHHRLGINNTKIVLKNALQDHEAVELNWWLFDKEWYTQLTLRENYSRKEVSLYPDAFFSLHDRVRDKYAYFFLEIDTGTEDHTKLLDKMKRYLVLATNQQLTSPHLPHKEIKGFRVLFVMNSEARRENLLKRAQHLPNKKGMFYIGLRTDIDLKEPKKLLTPIWKTLRPAMDAQGRPLLPLNGQLVFANKSILE
jgi:hypothetical protein